MNTQIESLCEPGAAQPRSQGLAANWRQLSSSMVRDTDLSGGQWFERPLILDGRADRSRALSEVPEMNSGSMAVVYT